MWGERVNMNKVILIGRLTRDPELRHVGQNNTATTSIVIAVDRPGRDADPDFIRIIVWGQQAENVCKYLSKGRQIAVEARIQTGQYTDKEGKTVYTTDVVANNVEFLGSGGGKSAGQPAAQPARNEVADIASVAEEDIPF